MRCFNCWRYHWEGQGWVRGVLDGVASAELKVQGWCLDHMVGFAERMGKLDKFVSRMLNVHLTCSWHSWLDHHAHVAGLRASAHRMAASMLNRDLAHVFYGFVDHRAAMVEVRRSIRGVGGFLLRVVQCVLQRVVQCVLQRVVQFVLQRVMLVGSVSSVSVPVLPGGC